MPKLNVFRAGEILARRLQHRFGRINCNDALAKDTKPFGHDSGAATEIAHDEVGIEQSADGFQMNRWTEKFFAQPAPLLCCRREESLLLRSTLRQYLLQAPFVVSGSR